VLPRQLNFEKNKQQFHFIYNNTIITVTLLLRKNSKKSSPVSYIHLFHDDFVM